MWIDRKKEKKEGRNIWAPFQQLLEILFKFQIKIYLTFLWNQVAIFKTKHFNIIQAIDEPVGVKEQRLKIWNIYFLQFYCRVPVRADGFACRLKTRSHNMQQSWTWAVAFQSVFAALHGTNTCTLQSVCSEPITQGSTAMQHGQVMPETAQNDTTLDFEWILGGCTPRNLLLSGNFYNSHVQHWNLAPSHAGLRSRVLTEVKPANEFHTEWILTHIA